MSRILTTSKLIESVRRRAMIPDDTAAFTDADIIDIMNEELDEQVISEVLVTNEEHLVRRDEISVEGDETKYTIPYRAIGNKLRDVAYLDSTGSHYELSRVSLEELSDYRRTYTSYNRDVFYVMGDAINLLDTRVIDYDKLVFYYYMRPSVLVEEKEVGKITNIDRVNGTITLQSFPSKFSNIPDMDFVKAKTPNTIISFDVTPTAVNNSTRVVSFNISDIPEELQVGDYLCQAEQTPVPNIPTEFHPILAQATAVHILEAMGDTEGLANASRKLEKMKEAIIQITNDRVEGAPQKINPRHSTLNQTSSYGLRKRRRL